MNNYSIGATLAGLLALRIAYGYHLRDGPDRDPLLEMFETGGFFISNTPAAFLADIIPIFRFWPEWFPGGGFHTTAKAWSKQFPDTIDTGLQYVKNEMVGGSDTTASQLEAFFLAMMLYPAVQATAQRELDRVVGHDRLPDINDHAQLPYIDALCKEVVRWHVAVPLAVPHRTREDYIYERGGDGTAAYSEGLSLIIPNLWYVG
ncbi:cytochrome P450 [Mycena olivaceomarginata]|nr:cytochrome P450 [Mycena olivaceomarginata]